MRGCLLKMDLGIVNYWPFMYILSFYFLIAGRYGFLVVNWAFEVSD